MRSRSCRYQFSSRGLVPQQKSTAEVPAGGRPGDRAAWWRPPSSGFEVASGCGAATVAIVSKGFNG